jgi:hypothetical protein
MKKPFKIVAINGALTREGFSIAQEAESMRTITLAVHPLALLATGAGIVLATIAIILLCLPVGLWEAV